MLKNIVFKILQIYVIMNMYMSKRLTTENRRTVELYNIYQQKSVRYVQNLKKGTIGLSNGLAEYPLTIPTYSTYM